MVCCYDFMVYILEDEELELFVVDGFLGGLYDWRGLVFNVKR